jgi:cation-transporting ATPase E
MVEQVKLTGLTEQEAVERRSRGQGNNVRPKTGRTYSDILIQNTFTFMNVIFFLIGAVMIVLGLWSDAIITVGVVAMNVVIGISQEMRAKRQLDKIALLTRPTVKLVREGKERVADPDDIVVDDLLIVTAGDQIVVDGPVIGGGVLEVDESLLTGESDLVRKAEGDQLLSGSFAVTGTAMFRAEKVGLDSYANKLTQSARAFRTTITPLQRDVNFVVRILVLLAVIYGVLFAISFTLRQVSAVESVRTAAVIIGMVPNGLFFMVVAAYAMGALRMSGRGALIQQVNAIESMSNVNVLCLDKTGTLTANRIHLEEIVPLGGRTPEDTNGLLGRFAASVTTHNRTSEAIHEAYPAEAQAVSAEVPFSSERKWSALALDGQAYVLGAPEVIAPALALDAELDQERIDGWTDQGLRVLLFAASPDVSALTAANTSHDLPHALEPLALLTFSDELRPEARETLDLFKKAGIALKIISGDNPQTVAALARQAGFPPGIKMLTGAQIDQLDDLQLGTIIEDTTIFGRIRPEQKERLVETLRARGSYVAMIGDGVNDVMSLKKAQIGVAMQSGSQATRGVADIVLMNDSFAALPAAFLEGQRILNGMKDIVSLFLTRVFYYALIIFGVAVVAEASLFPFIPAQGGMLTLVTIGIPTFALAAWAKPGHARRRILTTVVHFVLPASVTISFVGILIYVFYLFQVPFLPSADLYSTVVVDALLATPRSALLTFLVLSNLALVVFVEPPMRFLAGGDEPTNDMRPTILAGFMLLLYALIVIVEPLRRFFQIQLLMPADYLLIAVVVLLWAMGLRFMWRTGAFTRFLGLHVERYHEEPVADSAGD